MSSFRNSFRNLLPLIVAVLVGVGILGVPASVRADFRLYLQYDGGAITQVQSGADFSAISYTGNFGTGGTAGTQFTVSIFGSSSTNGISLSDLSESTTAITNNTASTHILTLYATQTDYSLPSTTQLKVESGLGGTLSKGTLTMTNIFQAYADSANNLLGMSDFTNGPQSATAIAKTFDTGTATGTFTRGAGDYSLTSVATFQLSGGGKANFSSEIDVTPTPAPAGVVLVLSALPFLGIGTWLRGRKVKAQNT